jgi:hypothetical protein
MHCPICYAVYSVINSTGECGRNICNCEQRRHKCFFCQNPVVQYANEKYLCTKHQVEDFPIGIAVSTPIDIKDDIKTNKHKVKCASCKKVHLYSSRTIKNNVILCPFCEWPGYLLES